MNSNWSYWQGMLPLPERGRPFRRIIEGIFWAAVSILVIMVVVTVFFHVFAQFQSDVYKGYLDR